MWNLSKRGFTSAVLYDPDKDFRKDSPFRKIAPQKGTHILIRARVREHLEPFRELLPTIVLVDDRAADYRWRAVVPTSVYKAYLLKQVDEMDYDSHFKEAMRAAQPKHLASDMYTAAMSTWGNFMKVQSKWGSGSEPKALPAGKGAGDWQTAKGVKPFRQKRGKRGQGGAKRRGHSNGSYGSDYEARTDRQRSFEEALSERIAAQNYLTPDEFIDFLVATGKHNGVVTMVNLSVTSKLKLALDDEAYELLRRLHAKYGAMSYLSLDIVENQAAALKAEADSGLKGA